MTNVHDESTATLIATLRRSLTLICQRPPVRVQLAYAGTIDAMQDALGKADYVFDMLAQAPAWDGTSGHELNMGYDRR